MRGSRLRFLLSLLGFLYGTIPEPEAVVSGFQDVAVVGEAIQEGGRHLGVAEHLEMPQRLTGESLRSGSLIRIIPCMAAAFRSAIDDLDGDRR